MLAVGSWQCWQCWQCWQRSVGNGGSVKASKMSPWFAWNLIPSPETQVKFFLIFCCSDSMSRGEGATVERCAALEAITVFNYCLTVALEIVHTQLKILPICQSFSYTGAGQRLQTSSNSKTTDNNLLCYFVISYVKVMLCYVTLGYVIIMLRIQVLV